MPIKVRQNAGLTAPMAPGAVKGSSLTHAELDENFRSIWPIGSIYCNMQNKRNPRDIIGFGVWKSFGRQTILVGTNNSPAAPGVANVTQNDLSARIASVRLVQRAPSTGQCRLEITTSSTHNFSVGQRVTLSGLSVPAQAGRVQPNGEREILTLGTIDGQNPNTKFIVDYRSPSRQSGVAILGSTATITVASNAAATLFGTRYDETQPRYTGVIGYNGTGGEFSHNLTKNEIPSHKHSWSASYQNAGASGDGSEWYQSGSGAPAARRNHTGIAFRGFQMSGPGLDGTIDDVKLSARGHRPDREGGLQNHSTKGFAHENLMPFVGCYMWIRTA